jgi:hypothetical protein
MSGYYSRKLSAYDEGLGYTFLLPQKEVASLELLQVIAEKVGCWWLRPRAGYPIHSDNCLQAFVAQFDGPIQASASRRELRRHIRESLSGHQVYSLE